MAADDFRIETDRPVSHGLHGNLIVDGVSWRIGVDTEHGLGRLEPMEARFPAAR